MKNKNKFYSFFLASTFVVLFLILASSTASAVITENRLSSYDVISNPDINGNKIIWQDYRDGNIDTVIFDLSTKKETHINLNGRNPTIYGNNLVYHSYSGPFGNIYMYDLKTKKETLINSYPGYAEGDPVINSNIIAWEDKRNINEYQDWDRYPGDIYMYDISKKKESKITTEGSSPSIYNNKIVWDNFMEGSGNIYMYDVSTKKIKQISYSGSAIYPDIYGNKIVWQDWRSGNNDIYMFDLSTKKETRITTNQSNSENPSIYGNTIVWQDDRNGNWDIYAYDLVTHQQIHTTNKSDQFEPAIYGNKIAWVDSNTYARDELNNGITITGIFSGTISFLPVAAFTATPTKGTHPLNVQFTDKSSDAYYLSWNFGDKTTSTLPSPLHQYKKAGKYTVTLTVKNAAGKNTVKKTNYITVK